MSTYLHVIWLPFVACFSVALVLFVVWLLLHRPDGYENPWIVVPVWVFTVLAVVGLVVASIGTGVEISYQVNCRNSAANLGVPSRWSVSAGCYFQLPDGKWWPASRVRNIDGQLDTGSDVQP